MSRTSTCRRTAAALGASGLIALTLAGPAAARLDPGTGGLHERLTTLPYSQDVYQNHYGPAPQRPAEPSVVVRFVDDDALEYLQLGAGVAGGLALGAAGMLLVSRRGHGHSHLSAA